MSYATDLPTWASYDLVVCGGGPWGIPAALAARRAGLSVTPLLSRRAGPLAAIGAAAGGATGGADR